MSSGKFKSKQQWASTTFLLEWRKSEALETQMLARTWNKTNSQLLPVGMLNDTATLEDNLAVSSKTKHTLTIRPSHCTLVFAVLLLFNCQVMSKAYLQNIVDSLLLCIVKWCEEWKLFCVSLFSPVSVFYFTIVISPLKVEKWKQWKQWETLFGL